jgi:alcohol dehydrogenase YqhD (iron-dependent ADH family)
MNNFEYWSPTKVIFGEDTVKNVGNEVKAFGGHCVLIIYGGGSVVKSGLLEVITKSLDESYIAYYCVGGVQPNPLAEYAQEIADKYKNKEIDFVLGVGGGSAIDTAKAVAHGLANPDATIWDIFTLKEPLNKSLPIGAILTIAAAGSETSASSVLTGKAAGIKRGINTHFNRPAFAIMDPVLTYTTPQRHTVCGIVDIIMHTLDRYFAPDTQNAMTDAIAEALMRVVIDNGRLVLENPNSYEARSELFWAGSLSHNGLTGLGQTMDFAVHQLGHAISAKYDIPHGESLAIAWPAWAKYVYKDDTARFAKYARQVWGITQSDDEMAALEGIEATTDYFKEIGAPVTLTQAIGTVTDDIIDELVDICTFRGTRTIGAFKILDANDIKAIYELAK